MRLWSLHPKYLDQQGLCGLWREAIMAKNALEQGENHGYWNHPQLERFKRANFIKDISPDPIILIDSYLTAVYDEARERGYDFDPDKFDTEEWSYAIPVTNGQLEFEYFHLADKLEDRGSIEKVDLLDSNGKRFLDLHPLFYMINGPKADWEKGGQDE